MTMPTCETCRFWFWEGAIMGDTKLGLCRRHAPIVRGDDGITVATMLTREWPVTTPRDWCGEHEPAEDGR